MRMLMEDISETTYIQDLLPEFEAKTGATVQFELVAYSSMYEKLVPQLSGPEGSGTYDVVAVDYYWPGEFARSGWMLPLDDWIARDQVDYSGIFPASFEVNGTVDGTTYYVPYYTYPMGLVYRNDMGISIPATMEEYVALAKSLKSGDLAGAAMQGAPTDPIAMEWLNYLYANGGDLYAEDLKTPTINNEAGLTALNQYIDLIDNAAQTGAAGANLDDAMESVRPRQGSDDDFVRHLGGIQLPGHEHLRGQGQVGRRPYAWDRYWQRRCVVVRCPQELQEPGMWVGVRQVGDVG